MQMNVYQLDECYTLHKGIRKKTKVVTISIAWLIIDVHKYNNINNHINPNAFIVPSQQIKSIIRYVCGRTIGMSSDIEFIVQYSCEIWNDILSFLSTKQLIAAVKMNKNKRR